MEYSDTEKAQIQALGASASNKQKTAPRRKPRAVYIVQEGEGGPIYRIETPESYAGRKQISSSNVTSLKKLARIKRVRDRGYVKRLATNADVRRYGPAIVMPAGDEKAAA